MYILIIGASGYLGKHVYNRFIDKYSNVIGTYCVHQTNPELIRFDINKDNIESIAPCLVQESGCAILCAAESKYDACKNNAEESFQTNVTSTIKLIEKLNQMKYHILFCSTDSVYEGTKGNYKENDQVRPVNEYGDMKLQVEQYIKMNCPNACVFRLSKMVGDIHSQRDTFREWKKLAEDRKDIYCIRDNYFSPVDVMDVTCCIEIACNRRISGVYNVCGDVVYSRANLCVSFLHTLGLEADVYEKDLEEFGFSALRPLNVGMSNQKVVRTLGYKFKSMQEVYKRYINIE